jgi:hypothetical protein
VRKYYSLPASLALLLITPLAIGFGAPPDESCDARASVDDCIVTVARELNGRGQHRFDEGDYLGAIEMWEQVLVMLPESRRGQLRVPLAHAHSRAYEHDADPAHLRAAHSLFTEQLASLDPGDGAREEIERELALLADEFQRLADAAATAEMERDERIRREALALRERALAEAEAAHHRHINKISFGVGGGLAGLGTASLAVMVAMLVRGNQTEADGQSAQASLSAVGEYYMLLSRGAAYNTTALATGVIGGVLLTGGLSLVSYAAVRHNRQRHLQRAELRPIGGGLVLRF